MVPLTPNQRQEVARICRDVVFPTRYAQLEKLLGDGPHFCGEELTIADIQFYVLTSAVLAGTLAGNRAPRLVPQQCPWLVAQCKRIGELPKVVEWNAAYPRDWFG